MSYQKILLISGVVFLSSYTGTALMRYIANRFGWMAYPRKDRWHKKPTALHGGVGFYPAFFFGVLYIIWQSGHQGSLFIPSTFLPSNNSQINALLLGASFIFFFGLWDDHKTFRPATKLLFQLMAISLFIYYGGIFSLTGTYTLDLLITYFWFVGIINAVNMLDNMDGLSSGVVIISLAVVVILSWKVQTVMTQEVLAIPLGLILIAALLGFWFHNRPPASIFMGDSGSLFIGYVLAALAMPNQLNGHMGLASNGNLLGASLSLLIPVTVIAIPILDTTLVTITRTWRAQKPSEGGKDHISHRLVGLGLSEKTTIWVLYVMSTFGGTIAVLMQWLPEQSLLFFGFFILAFVLTGVYLGHVKIKRVDQGRIPPIWTPLISNILYKRHAAEIILDTFLSILCFYAAHLLRFEGRLPQDIEMAMIQAFPIVAPSTLLALFLAGIYRGQWRLISIPEVPAYGLGVMGGTVLSLAVVTLVTRFDLGFSRSAYIIYGMLFFLTLIGSRLSFCFFDLISHKQNLTVKNHSRKPVLIYGAGKGGKLLFDEITFNPKMSDYTVVGFADDDPDRIGQYLCNLPIRKGTDWGGEFWGHPVEVWVSSRTISDERVWNLTRQWNPRILIRRLNLKIEPVLHLGNKYEDQPVLKVEADAVETVFKPPSTLPTLVRKGGWSESQPISS